MKKRLIAALLALICLFALAVPAMADTGETATIRNPREMLTFGGGDVCITPCVLHTAAGERPVYLICLCGAGYDLLKHNNAFEFFASAASLPTGYLRVVKNAAKSAIPQGSAVLLIGHSLGGNIAQQFAADRDMRSRYEILNVCTCGSPYILTANREGSLHRLGDVLDVVPYLSLAGPANLFLDISYELGGFSGRFALPHSTSYYYSSVWDSYDCFGVKNGGAYLTADPDSYMAFSLQFDLF